MTFQAALANLNRAADQLRSRTLYDDILATIRAVAALNPEPEIAEACVRDMMKTRYTGLQIITPFQIDEEGDWGIVVRHFDGLQVAITNKE